jgi:hypothetical protein
MRNSPGRCNGVGAPSSIHKAAAVPDRFPIFDVKWKKQGRKWAWAVGPTDGAPIMLGLESSRSAASYRANRALFLLLLSSQRSARAEARVRR